MDYAFFSREMIPAILVADDVAENLDLLRSILLREGYIVYAASDGTTALHHYKNHAVDIAILDVMMPGINGFQLCETLKELSGKKFFPIVLLTALNDTNSRVTGIKAGADDFISKPFETSELITKIKSLLKLKSLQEDLDHSENIIFSLVVALERRDFYTKGHSTRVGELSAEFVSFLGGKSKDQDLIRKAGMLHDIGKMGVSEMLLSKAGKLTVEEYNEVRKHTVIGEDICRSLTSLKDILPAIRSHHERWDGKGFPDRLSGNDIPMVARVLSIIDTYDAMVSARPYRDRRTSEQALKVFESERFSGQWDPELTAAFYEMMKMNDVCASRTAD